MTVTSPGRTHDTESTLDTAQAAIAGITAMDRAGTLRALANLATTPGMLRRPGHVFPLRARTGGLAPHRGGSGTDAPAQPLLTTQRGCP